MKDSTRIVDGLQRLVPAVLVALLALVVGAPDALAIDNSGWYWPVPDSLSMSRGYSSGHKAIDITAGGNVSIVAARAGTVIAVFGGCTQWDGYGKSHSACSPVAHLTSGDLYGIRWHQDDGGTDVCNYGFGNGVIIDHGNGVLTSYAHMASTDVSVGQSVGGGTKIGTMGSYGNSTGRHLHFAMWENGYLSTGGYPHGTEVNCNPYGTEYIVHGSWNGVDNIYYSRDYNLDRQPLGVVDSCRGGAGTIFISGWAYDPDAPSQSIPLHVYIDGSFFASIPTDQDRPDVNGCYDISGKHGFSIDYHTTRRGSCQVEVYAINDKSSGVNPRIASYTINVTKPTGRNGTPADLPTDVPFVLIPKASNHRAMTIREAKNDSDTFLQGGIEGDYGNAFRFSFVKHSSGAYGIRWEADRSYYLHVSSLMYNWCHRIVGWQGYGNGNSLWTPERNTDGTWSFWNGHYGTYIDLYGAYDEWGTPFVSFEANATNAQKFHLVPVGKSLSADDVEITCIEQTTYAGKAATPKVTVKYLGTTLVEGEDYTVSYSNNDRPGTATVTIRGVGGTPNPNDLRGYRGYYTGVVKRTFKIVGEAPTGTGWRDLPEGGKGYAKDGKWVTGWLELGGGKYWFDADGVMACGWTDVQVAGKTMHYYFNPASGNLVRGTWFTIEGKTYYFRTSGNLATGWATIDDHGVEKKYYLDEDGQMLTGWQDIEVNGKAMRYYFRPSGAMATGWATIDGEKYWFRPSGNMATGFADVDDAYKRYFDESGHMLTGWQDIGGKTYYFRASGAMQTGRATIDGLSYTFSSSGVLQGLTEMAQREDVDATTEAPDEGIALEADEEPVADDSEEAGIVPEDDEAVIEVTPEDEGITLA